MEETKIKGSHRKRNCLERSLEVCFCRFLFYPYLLGSDVGSLWSQGLEGTSASIGCGWALFTVARIRRNFCQYRMWTRMYSSIYLFGRDWNRRESEEKALLGKAARGCGRECTRICWAPMWDHDGLKDEKKLLSV